MLLVNMTATEARLAAVDRDVLRPIVREALGATSVEIVESRCKHVRGGAGGGVGANATAVFRFSGRAQVDDTLLPWSVVLKVLYARGDEDPSGSHYWRREADAYKSGLFRSLPGGLSAPHCFGVWEHPGESCWLWLEDVTDEIGAWPLERYGLVATQLGLFNATCASRPNPPWPWLSERWIRKDLDQIGAQIDLFANHREDTIMRRFFPPDTANGTLRLWSEREIFLAALESLPVTLCHHDAFRRNLFARQADGANTVLIDWSFLGQSPLGTEIVSLTWVSLVFCEVGPADAPDLSDLVFRSYVSGLREGGWRGKVDQVRLAYLAAIALRRLGTTGYMLPVLLDPSKHSETEKVVGCSMDAWGDRYAEAGRFVDSLAEKARELISESGALR